MRVLFLTPYYKPYLGGIERVIDRLGRALMTTGAAERVGVMTTHYAFPRRFVPDLADYERRDGQDIYRLRSMPHAAPPAFSVPLVWFSPGAMRGVIEQFRPDVLHFVGDGWFWAHLCCAGMARRRDIAVVFTPSFHTLRPQRAWLRPLNAVVTHFAQITTVLTAQERAQVRTAYLAPDERLRVLPWGVDLPADETRHGRGGDAEAPVEVLCVGRLGRHKGQMWLVETFALALARTRRRARLVLVGRDEGDRGGEAAIRERVAALGLADAVEITGEVDDETLAEAYRRADLFALFSQYEAFGLAPLEAMGYAVPVLSHRVGGNHEVLRAGAALVGRYDQEAAVREMVRLIEDDAARERLGNEGRAYARGRFSWERAAERYAGAYREAMALRGRTSAWGADNERARKAGRREAQHVDRVTTRT